MGDFPGAPVVKTSPSDAGDVGRFLVEKRKQYCNKFNKDFKNGPHLKNKTKQKKTQPTKTAHTTNYTKKINNLL